MGKVELQTFPNAEALAGAAATQWLGELREGNSPHYVALSGGRIAGHFFDAAAAKSKEKAAALSNVHFFWGDERCVPPTDPESNFRLAWERLLKPLGVEESKVHRIRGEDEPVEAARAAESDLRRFILDKSGGVPSLDIVLLGMGEEGHIASLFPGETADLITSPAIFRAVTASKPPPRRITIGYPALAAARQVWLLASGAGKEAVLREALAGKAETPIGRLLDTRQQTRVFTDLL